MKDIAFLVTGAHSIPGATPELYRERYLEYMIALQKIFSYQKPVYGVLSECDPEISAINAPPFDLFPFQTLSKLPRVALQHCQTKSQREFLSIQCLIQSLQGDLTLDDDTFIIKVSGRYILLKDTMLHLVEQQKTNKDVQAIICLTKGVYPIQQYTFCFALRWKWFQKFYNRPIQSLGAKCVERFIVEFIEEENLQGFTMNVEELGILCNINNENKFQVL
jgi:hypothetical protein